MNESFPDIDYLDNTVLQVLFVMSKIDILNKLAEKFHNFSFKCDGKKVIYGYNSDPSVYNYFEHKTDYLRLVNTKPIMQ
jgi:hypothetical protein